MAEHDTCQREIRAGWCGIGEIGYPSEAKEDEGGRIRLDSMNGDVWKQLLVIMMMMTMMTVS